MLNPTQCTFGVRARKFLGYMVTKKGIEVNQANETALKDLSPPRNIKEVQALNGRIATLN